MKAKTMLRTLTKKAYENNEDYQILCVVKNKGDWCAQMMNELVHRDVLGGQGITMNYKIMPKDGEKIIVLKNNYAKDESGEFSEDMSTMNGDVGYYKKPSTLEEFHKPNHICMLRQESGGGHILHNRMVYVPEENYDLGHAISVHKSQGSEYDKVVLVLDRAGGRLLVRELLYTAITRAKKELVIIADPMAFAKCNETPIRQRNSKLADLVNAEFMVVET